MDGRIYPKIQIVVMSWAKTNMVDMNELLKKFHEAATGRTISDTFIDWFIKQQFPTIQDIKNDIWGIAITDKNYGKIE